MTATPPETVPGATDDVTFSSADAAALLREHTHILDLLAKGASRTRILDRVVSAIEELVPGSIASILLYDSAFEHLRHGSALHLPAAYLAAIDGLVPGPTVGSCGTAAYLNERVIVPDVRTDHRWRDFRAAAAGAGLVACWSTPIGGHEGRPVGTFALYHRGPHVPSTRELRLVDRFCYLASVVIGHTRVLDELIANEVLFRRSFEDNAASMMLLDEDLRVTRANDATVTLTGYAVEELVGAPITSLLRPISVRRAPFTRWLRTPTVPVAEGDDIDGGRRVTQTVTVTTRSGQERSAEATASAIRSSKNTSAILVVTVIDLTEREAMTRALLARREAEVAKATAEAHSLAKSQLLTAVSHEIRSPLQAITGFTELLATLDLDQDRRAEALRQITVAADHLLDIVTDVLDMTRVEAAAVALRREAVDLRRSVLEAVDLVTPLAQSRHVRVDLADGPDIGALADPRRVVQILVNLLRNAVQHGVTGGRISITIIDHTEDCAQDAAHDAGSTPSIIGSRTTPQRVWIRVGDDGPGIPAARRATVFAPWFHHPEEADGYGLGLMLARSLAEAMDGELTVAASPEGGAQFTLGLPQLPQLPPAPGARLRGVVRPAED